MPQTNSAEIAPRSPLGMLSQCALNLAEARGRTAMYLVCSILLMFLIFPAHAAGISLIDTGAAALVWGLGAALLVVMVKLLAKFLDLTSKASSDTPLNIAAGGVTALMKAAANGDVEVAAKLISTGSNVNEVDHQGATSLMFSAEKGRNAILEMLLLNGADRRLKSHAGYTAAQYASGYESERHTRASMLLKKNSLIDKVLWKRLSNEFGGEEKLTKDLYLIRRTEEILAEASIRNEKLTAEQRLVESLAKTNAAQVVNSDLAEAVTLGNLSRALNLLDDGVSPFGSDSNGDTLLDMAKKSGDQQMIELLNRSGHDG